MKIILRLKNDEDWLVAGRAAQYLIKSGKNDGCVGYGDDPNLVFYMKKNKASITVTQKGWYDA